MKIFRCFTLTAALTLCIGAQAFEIQKVRIAPWQTQKGADETAHLTRKGYYPVVAMPSKTVLEFDKRLSLAQIRLAAEPGTPWEGWKLMRITVTAPAPIVGDATLDITYDDIMLEDTPAKSEKVTLDVMGNTILGSEAHNYYICVYPAAVSSGEITLEYYLRKADNSRTQVVTHTVPVSGTAFEKGVPTVISDRIGYVDGKNWKVREYKTDTEYYKNSILKMLKNCDMATMQITYVDHLDSIAFIAVNEDFYNAKPERKKLIRRPFDMNSIYQAASMSKVPCGYIFTKLVSDGEIDLDTPLYKYYPGLLNRIRPQYREQAKLITGRMALTHTSGCGPGYGNIPLDLYPGYHLNYRNSNTVIAQYVIEYLKGKRIDDVAEEYIYSKRGMHLSRYEWNPCFDSLAVSYVDGIKGAYRNESWEKNDYIKYSDFPWDKGRKGVDNNTSYHWRTNSTECTRFWSWFLEGAELSEEMFNQFVDQGIHLPSGDVSLEHGTMRYGLVTRTDLSDELGAVTHHTGRNGPFRSVGIAFLERNAAISIFTNSRTFYSYYYPVLDLFIPHSVPLGWTNWVADAGTPVPNWTTTAMKKNGSKQNKK